MAHFSSLKKSNHIFHSKTVCNLTAMGAGWWGWLEGGQVGQGDRVGLAWQENGWRWGAGVWCGSGAGEVCNPWRSYLTFTIVYKRRNHMGLYNT